MADVPELKKLIAGFGKIGSNLNQIARHFNSGGIQSQEMRKSINQGIADIYEMKYAVLNLAEFKHHQTKDYLIHMKQSVMDICHRENLHQVDLPSPSEKKITEREYHASAFCLEEFQQILLEKYNIKQKVSQGSITPLLALAVNGRMYLTDQFTFIQFFNLHKIIPWLCQSAAEGLFRFLSFQSVCIFQAFRFRDF